MLMRCPKCGSPCRCVEGEICYFGCKHEEFKCSQQKELLFAWPCHHVELLREAQTRIKTQFSDPNCVHYPCCPKCSQPLTTSIVFAKEIARTKKILKRYYKKGKEKYNQILNSGKPQLLRCQFQCQLLNDPRSRDGFGVRIIEQNTSRNPRPPNETTKPNKPRTPNETTKPSNPRSPNETTKPNKPRNPNETTKPNKPRNQKKTKKPKTN